MWVDLWRVLAGVTSFNLIFEGKLLELSVAEVTLLVYQQSQISINRLRIIAIANFIRSRRVASDLLLTCANYPLQLH